MTRGSYEERAARNDVSRSTAAHHTEEWTANELEMLLELWDGSEDTLADLAEILGRTVEACRQKFYTARKAATAPARRRTVTTEIRVTRTTVDEDFTDQPGWYV